MTTFKSYTSLPQAEILSKILPLESADMYYPYFGDNEFGETPRVGKGMEFSGASDIPCWSLDSLLKLLPNEIQIVNDYQIAIRKYDGGNNVTLYQIAYGNRKGSSGSWHDMINTREAENLIDCCVVMIEELNKHGWL